MEKGGGTWNNAKYLNKYSNTKPGLERHPNSQGNQTVLTPTKPESQGGKAVLPIHNVRILKLKKKKKSNKFLKRGWHGV